MKWFKDIIQNNNNNNVIRWWYVKVRSNSFDNWTKYKVVNLNRVNFDDASTNQNKCLTEFCENVSSNWFELMHNEIDEPN